MKQFETLLTFLADPKVAAPTLEARETICLVVNQVRGELAAADAPDKARAEADLRRLAAVADGGNAFTASIAFALLHGLTGEVADLSKAIAAALEEDAEDVGVGVNNLFLIDRLEFVNMPGALAGVCDYDARHHYWLKLIDRAKAAVAGAGVARKSAFALNDRVLILTEQFLQPPHAPSKDALEFARRFQDAGREAMIVSTCAIGLQVYSVIQPGARGSLNESLGGVSGLTFEGREYGYHQPPSGRFNSKTLSETLTVIEQFDPAFVLSIGGQNLVAELLTSRSFVVQYPTFAGLPTVESPNFFMWREPTDEEMATMARLGIADRYLFAHHPGFERPERTVQFNRAQFGVPEDDFVFAVVGMRLDLDVGDDFIALMRDIRARRASAHFLFVGDFNDFEARIGTDTTLAGAATHIGHQSDVMAALELCDAYINPTRRGGGSAIVHAISAGLPALSVNVGDAYEAVRDLPTLLDYAALADAACALVDRGEVYEAYLAAVRAKAPTLGGKAGVVEKLLAAYDSFVRAAGPR